MVATVVDSDATFFHRPKDQLLERRCLLLEQLLQEKTGTHPRTISFAIGGEMASDAYGIASVILKDQYKPRTIVWGIAPRDLVDRTFINPNESGIAQYVSKAAGRADVFGGLSFWDKVERALDKVSYIYGNRDAGEALQTNCVKGLLAACGWQKLETDSIPDPLKKYAYASFPEDEGIDNWVNVPTETVNFNNNLKEYHERYTPFNNGLYETQLRATHTRQLP
jgi:hypothetical protein